MKLQKGQIALIALLVLTVAVTVGLSLIARSTTNVAITRNMEESSRAFSAAEAGIEETLKSGAVASSQPDSNLGASYETDIIPVSTLANEPFIFPRKTSHGETETLWLVTHKTDNSIVETPTYTANSIDVCWGTSTPVPAMVLTVFYKESMDGSYRVVKDAVDPDTDRVAVDKFNAPTAIIGGCGNGTNTTYKQTVTFNSLSADINPVVDTLIMLRMRPVYADAQLAVVPAADLPHQITYVVSTGTTPSGVNRKIEVFQQYNSPSTIFDSAVYSEGSFMH